MAWLRALSGVRSVTIQWYAIWSIVRRNQSRRRSRLPRRD